MKNILTIILNVLVLGLFAQDIKLNGDELFGDLKARQIGPALMSGRINDLEGHPTNPRIIYAGAAGGGVWRSVNGGASFQPIFDKHTQSIGNIALDPKNPDNTIWVGTGETWTRNSVSVGDGLYKSTDGGSNWNRMGFENSERISSIEIHPDNTSTVYVGVLGALWGDSEERGVYKTEDDGQTWQRLLYIDQKTGCADLILDPSNPNVLYASMWEFRRSAWGFESGGGESGLYKSIDGGASWNKIHQGFPEGKLGRIGIALAPSNPKILYAAIESEKKEDRGLYRSNDGGSNWTQLNNDFGLVVRPFYFSRIVVDPKDPDVVVKAGLFGSISRDGGRTFKNLGQMHPDIHDILFDIKDSDRMYVGTDGGVYRTWDGATTMEIVANLPISQFYHVSVDNDEPYNVYGGLQDNGSWYAPSSSPGGIEARDWNNVGFGDGFRVLRHPTKKIIYSEMQGAQFIWRYDMDRNQSKSIQPLPVAGDPKLRFNWNAPMAISASQPDRIFVGSQFLHKSDDMGNSWVKISPDLTTNDAKKQNQESSGGLSTDNSGAENHCTIFTIVESALDENIIWVGTDDGNIQITRDGGETWSNVTANIPDLPANTWVYQIEGSSHDKATAYAVFDGHTQNDKNTYIYKTNDFGQTWTSLATDELYGYARTIQEDYENEDLLFLGTEFGLFITIDGGKSWGKFTKNMPPVAVHAIELHQKTGDLVMGTHGRGIIIIDDISPLRQINQEVLAKEVHFFESKPAVIDEQSGFGGTSTEMEYVGPNPNRDAKITYYMKKRHIFGKMGMEIQDMAGNQLIELSPGKSKGINVVTWNYRIKQPKLAKGRTFSFGGFTAPRVPSGKYKVLMTKGKKTFESEITLVNDPKSLLTETERENLQNTTMQLYGMSQELAYLVYQIDEYVASAQTLKKGDAKASKTVNPVIDELNALKESLVVTTGDNYVDSAEPQLRGKIADLYSKVAGGFSAPSSSELQNLTLLEERFSKAKSSFEEIKLKRIFKMEKYLEKSGSAAVQIKSFDDYIND